MSSMSQFPDTHFLYTPLSVALGELESRRKNRTLVDSISRHFGSLPDPFQTSETRLVAAPPIVTPNFEFRYVIDIVRHTQLPITFLEYGNDKFAHVNFEKRFLGEMVFCQDPFTRQPIISDKIRIIDFDDNQGKRFNEINTTTGEKFIDFHHRILAEAYPGVHLDIHDFSDWFERSRSFDMKLPYLRYLGLFMVNSILLVNFVTEKSQGYFTNTVVIPAFRRLKELFGVAPLIVPIEPIDTDHDDGWCYYENRVRDLI